MTGSPENKFHINKVILHSFSSREKGTTLQPIICKFIAASLGHLEESTCDILATERDTGEHMGNGARAVQPTQQFVVFEPKLKDRKAVEMTRR